jgi:hypothetical protein
MSSVILRQKIGGNNFKPLPRKACFKDCPQKARVRGLLSKVAGAKGARVFFNLSLEFPIARISGSKMNRSGG